MAVYFEPPQHPNIVIFFVLRFGFYPDDAPDAAMHRDDSDTVAQEISWLADSMMMYRLTKIIIWTAAFLILVILGSSELTRAMPGSISDKAASAGTQTGTGSALEFELIATGGYRVDDWDWNISGFNYRFSQHWALNANFDYLDWSTEGDTSKFFFADGSDAKTRLNEVNWTSWAGMFGLSFGF